MPKFEQLLAMTPALLALEACDGRGGVNPDYAEGYQDGYEDGQEDGGLDGDRPDTHAQICEDLLWKAEAALADGLTASVIVDADPNELASGYDGGRVWMYDAFDTDDGNNQPHVPCTSLRIDGNWTVSGEADYDRDGSDLDMLVEFDGEAFDASSMVKLNWVVVDEAGARFATDMNGNESTLYSVDHESESPIGY